MTREILHPRRLYLSIAATFFVLCGTVSTSISAANPNDFYAGRTVILLVAGASGGGYDTIGRIMARHLPKHLPGRPTITVQNLPAAGGLVAANNLFNIAPRDGTTIGLLQREVFTAKLIAPNAVRFDVDKFGWLGSLATEPSVVFSSRTAPVQKFDELFSKELIVGGNGPTVGNEVAARLMNKLIGTKFKIISGYPGTTDILLGLQRGEVQGIVDYSYSNLVTRNLDVTILMQLFDQRLASLPDVPTVFDYLKTDLDRAVMNLLVAGRLAARPVAAPPDVPFVQMQLLRSAFSATVRDPEYLAEVKKAGLEATATSAEDVVRIGKRISSTPRDASEQYGGVGK